MDQDASIEEAEDQTLPIPQEARAEQPELATGSIDPITTPEAEMDVDLPQLTKTDASDNGSRKEIRMEIPDSEDVSEASSPVKDSKVQEEKHDQSVELDGGLLTGQEMSDKGEPLEDTPKGKARETKTEIPNSEEVSELSSPVKVGAGMGAAGGGQTQVDEASEDAEERQDQDSGDVDTTMLDVAPAQQDDRIAGEDQSSAERGDDANKTEILGSEDGDSVDAIEVMDYTLEKNGSPLNVDDDGNVEQGTLSDTKNADTSPTTDEFKDPAPETSSAGASGETFVRQTCPDKGDELIATPAQTDTQRVFGSPAMDPQEIAITARKLLGNCPSSSLTKKCHYHLEIND
jgi:hypothetical protein